MTSIGDAYEYHNSNMHPFFIVTWHDNFIANFNILLCLQTKCSLSIGDGDPGKRLSVI